MIIHHLPSLKKRTMRVSLYFDTLESKSANFSRIVITTLVYAVIVFLTSRLQHSHITFLPQRTRLGELPLVSAHEASTTSEPPYLNPENAQVLISFILFLHFLQEFLAMFFYLTLVLLQFHQKQFLDFLQNPSF